MLERAKSSIFTEREFSGIFSLAGGILRFQNGNSRWPWYNTPVRQLTEALVVVGRIHIADLLIYFVFSLRIDRVAGFPETLGFPDRLRQIGKIEVGQFLCRYRA